MMQCFLTQGIWAANFATRGPGIILNKDKGCWLCFRSQQRNTRKRGSGFLLEHFLRQTETCYPRLTATQISCFLMTILELSTRSPTKKRRVRSRKPNRDDQQVFESGRTGWPEERCWTSSKVWAPEYVLSCADDWPAQEWGPQWRRAQLVAQYFFKDRLG